MTNLETIKTMNQAQLIKTIATLKFRPFTLADWDLFGDCESKDPLIAEDPDFQDACWILDGNTLQRMDFGGEESWDYGSTLVWDMTQGFKLIVDSDL